MRRNNYHSRGNASSRNNPLITGRQIQDLDMELELLKRKRQLIEQEQQYLTFEADRRQRPPLYHYDQRQQLNTGFEAPQNYSRYYDQPEPHTSNYGGSLLGKRVSHQSMWDNEPPYKRFAEPPRGGHRKLPVEPSPLFRERPSPSVFIPGSHQKSATNQKPKSLNHPPSSFTSSKSIPPSQKLKPNMPRRPKKDLKPPKVSKPQLMWNVVTTTDNFSPNNMASIVKQHASPQDCVLRPDVLPTQQVAGRLEVSVGSILREIKNGCNKDVYGEVFANASFVRHMKHEIRERLRDVMLNKYVGKLQSTVHEYRKVYSLQSDINILKTLLGPREEIPQVPIEIEKSDGPEVYFKTNMKKLLESSLENMFDELAKIIASKYPKEEKEIYESYIRDINNYIKKKGLNESDVMNMFDVSKDTSELENDTSNVTGETNDEDDVTKGTLEKSNEILEESKETNNATAETEKLEGDNSTKNDDKMNADVGELYDPERCTDEDMNNSHESEKIRKISEELREKLDFHITYIIKRRMSMMLTKYKPYIIKLLNINKIYVASKKKIETELRNKMANNIQLPEAQKPVKIESQVNTITQQSVAAKKKSYYLKIIGAPALPKKDIMQEFLQKFKPVSIKKHKNAELLFVELGSKEDFDKLLDVKETVLGDSTISVSVSEKIKKIMDQNKTETTPDASLIDDIDTQIDELLSFIRKEEESQDQALKEESQANKTPEEVNQKSVTDQSVNEVIEVQALNSDNVEDTSNKETDYQVNLNENDNEDDILNDKNDEKVNDEGNDEAKGEENDKVGDLKNEEKQSGTATPTRSSSRLSNVTPSSIRTRRASRLAQN